jgi:integrase
MRRGDVATNPVALTEKLKEKSRDRILSPAELKLVWKSLPANGYGTIVKVLMLTGQRLSEIARLRWSEVDFQRGVIALPGDRTKNSRPHEVPMSPTVRSLLASVPQNGRQTLFPAQMYDRRKKPLDAAIAKANGGESIPSWVHHDLRRTATTGMADIGVLPHIIEAVLNHISGHKAGVAGIYNRGAYSAEKRDALDRWDRHLTKLTAE